MKTLKHQHSWISCGAVRFWVCIDCGELKPKQKILKRLDCDVPLKILLTDALNAQVEKRKTR